MKIAIDLTSLDDNFSGLERYAMSLSKELIKIGTKDRFYLLFKNCIPKMFEMEVALSNVTPIIIHGKNRLLINQIQLPCRMSKIEADAYVFPAFPVPLLWGKKNTFGLIADMTYYDCPKTMKWKARVFFEVMIKHTQKKSLGIITISDFSEERIVAILGTKRKRIKKIYCGVEKDSFAPETFRETEIREKYHLPKQFLLSLSTIEPRKNISLLLAAYQEAVKNNENLPPLVLAGRSGWLMEEKIQSINEKKEGTVLLTGFIEEKDIATLYSMAECFIFPSEYEGFGMPPLEAQAAGVKRIISSDAPALKEVLGNTATFFANHDGKALQELLEQYQKIEPVSREAQMKNLERFSWHESAEQFYAWVKATYQPRQSQFKNIVRGCIPRSLINFRNQKRDHESLKKASVLMKEMKQENQEYLRKGINLFGDALASTGLGQSVRLLEGILKQSKIPYHLCILENDRIEKAWQYNKTEDYFINLFHVQPAKWLTVLESLPKEQIKGHYNIAYWLWETPQFPKEWEEAIQSFDEIWVPSEFIKEAVVAVTDKPVKVLSYAMQPMKIENVNPIRKRYQIPMNALVYLIMYDSLSGFERKNPMTALRAFCDAFPKERKDVYLIMKGKHLSGMERKQMQSALEAYSNVLFLENTMESEEVEELLAMSDVLLSLHHAEGYGLPLAEAMFQYTAVVATGWSGNMEFMSEENSCLIPYTMETLQKDAGPYRKGTVWAKPDSKRVAECIRALADNPDLLRDKKETAYQQITSKLSIPLAAKQMETRVEEIVVMHKS